MSTLFDTAIQKVVGKSKPIGKYALNPRSNKLLLNDKDVSNFNKLFQVTGQSQGVGYGEIALYWLFGSKSEHTASKNEPDLRIDGNSAEVKSYNEGLNKTFILGRFASQVDFREMISIIFGISNLSSSGTLKNSSRGVGQNFVDVLNFNYNDLVEASDKFCDLRSALHVLKNDIAGKRAFDVLPFLDGVVNNTNKFDILAKKNGLSNICGVGSKKPGGKLIGAELTKFLLKNLLGTKPGDKGYFVNVAKNSNTFDISYIQVDLSKINERSVMDLTKGFSAVGGQVNINLKYLFG